MKEMSRAEKVARGLDIFIAHGGPEIDCHHETLYAGCEGVLLYAGCEGDLTEEAEAKLTELGWLFDENLNSWFIFT